MFSPLLPLGTIQYKLIFSNGQESQKLLEVSFTFKVTQHKLQSNQTKHPLFPFFIRTGIIAPWCSRHFPSPSFSYDTLWELLFAGYCWLATEKYSSSVGRNRLPPVLLFPLSPCLWSSKPLIAQCVNGRGYTANSQGDWRGWSPKNGASLLVWAGGCLSYSGGSGALLG